MLKMLKTALSKKDKPIMTKGKHDNYLTLSIIKLLNMYVNCDVNFSICRKKK